MVAAAIVVAVGVLAGAGELAAAPLGVADPGPLVRFGLPVARVVHDLAASLTIGLLVLAVWAAAPESGSKPGIVSGARLGMLIAASVAAGAWLLSAAAVLAFTAAELAGISVTSPTFAGSFMVFVTRVDLGRALSVSLLMVAAVAVVTVLSSRVATAACAAGVALLALLPLSLTGHAAGSANHENAATSLALHLLGVSVWVGGLSALVLMARRLGPQLPTVAMRYSTLAGWCFAVVALSGLLSAALRLESLANATSLYGLVALAKVAALGLLGLAGWRHRVAVLPRLVGDHGRRAFVRLASAELLVMGASMGLAVALSRTATPPGAGHGAGMAATLPPPLTARTYLTGFSADLLWLSVAGAGLLWYVWATLSLRRHGGDWAVRRTVCWAAGCLLLFWVTSGGPAVYARTGFTTHLLQHLTLMLAVPLLLVLGAPVALALRTLRHRVDGSVGGRETLVMVLGSRLLGILRDPVVAAGLLAGGFIAFYYVPDVFELSLATHPGHVLMAVYFLLAGCNFLGVLLNSGQGQLLQNPLPARLVALALTGALVAGTGLAIRRSSTVLAADWWKSQGSDNPVALLQDQQLGGSLAVAVGVLLVALAGLSLTLRRASEPRPPASTEVDDRRREAAAL